VHGDFHIAGVDHAIRLPPGTAQRMRHRRAGITLNLGAMADQATPGASRLAHKLRSRDLSHRRGRSTVAGLSSTCGNSAPHGQQNDQQYATDIFGGHESARIGGPRQMEIVSRCVLRGEIPPFEAGLQNGGMFHGEHSVRAGLYVQNAEATCFVGISRRFPFRESGNQARPLRVPVQAAVGRISIAELPRIES